MLYDNAIVLPLLMPSIFEAVKSDPDINALQAVTTMAGGKIEAQGAEYKQVYH
jgi:hypothetical protein